MARWLTMNKKLRFKLPWEGERGGSSKVAWKFASHELKGHVRIFTLIIIIMAIVTTPFSLSLSFNHYLTTVVKSSIKDSVSAEVTIAYPKSVDIEEVAHGSSFILKDAEQRAELLRDKGLNASVRNVCFEQVVLAGGITHQAEIWGIDTQNDSLVCSLEDFIIEGKWFDPQIRYVRERETESFVEKLIQDMMGFEAKVLQVGVILLASFSITSKIWYIFMFPIIERIFEQISTIFVLAPYPISLLAGSADLFKNAIFPSRVTHPENPLASLLETLSPRLANILPILSMMEEVGEDVERLTLPTSVVLWVKIQEYANMSASKIPIVGKLINNLILFANRIISQFNVNQTRYPLQVGKSFAEDWGIEVGDTILIMPEFTGRRGGRAGFVPAEVVGIYDTGLAELERWKFYMPFESVAEMKGYREEEGVEILVKGNDEENTLAIVQETFDDVACFTWEDYVKIIYGSFVTIVLPLTLVVMIIALIAALAAIASIMDSIARRRTREVGYLKAYGLRNRGAINIVLYQALFMGVVAGIIGIGLFITGIYFLNTYLMVSIRVNPYYLLVVGLIPIITSILGALLPGLRIAKLQPVRALREGEMQV
jgi:putative ABC transport system permease protein